MTVFALTLSANAWAQNTGGVFPPMVNDGHKSAQFRIAINPDRNDTFGYASRLHYQQAISGDMMWRVIGQVRDTATSDMDLDFVQAELFWELSDDDSQHKHGLRFDARLRDGNRPEQLGLNFMNQFNLENGWRVRALGLSSVQVGDNANDGINLQSRFQLARSLPSKVTLGVEMYNNFGNTGNIGSFNNQSHTIGPFVATPLTQNVSVFAGPLFGMSDAAPDVEARLWLTRSF